MAISAIEAIASPMPSGLLPPLPLLPPPPSGKMVMTTTSRGPTRVRTQVAFRRTVASLGTREASSIPFRCTDTMMRRPTGRWRATMVESRRRRPDSRIRSPRAWPVTLLKATRVIDQAGQW